LKKEREKVKDQKKKERESEKGQSFEEYLSKQSAELNQRLRDVLPPPFSNFNPTPQS